MAYRKITAEELRRDPATVKVPVSEQLRRRVEQSCAQAAKPILAALGEHLPTSAVGFRDLERTLADAVQATVATEVMQGVLGALVEDEGFAQACVTRARAWRDLVPHRKDDVSVRLLSGASISVRTTYAGANRSVKRPGRRRGVGRHGARGRGCYPVLAQLGIVERATPALHSEVAWADSALGSSAEAQAALARRGIDLHINSIRLLAALFADAGIADRDQGVLPVPAPSPLRGKRVVIAVDGGRVRVREERPGRRPQSGRRKYETPWREPKLLAVYTIDDEGKKDKDFVFYEATLASYDEAFALFMRWLTRFGLANAREIVFAGDGSNHIWDRVPKVIEELQLDPEIVRLVVDFWHGAQHCFEAAKHLRMTNYEKSLRARHWKRLLREGKALELAEQIRQSSSSLRGAARKELENHAAYFESNAARMRYDVLHTLKLPIGTGVVESAIRRVVNLRLKGPGIFWDPDNAERMLLLRARLKAGRWEELEEAVYRHAYGSRDGPLRVARKPAPSDKQAREAKRTKANPAR